MASQRQWQEVIEVNITGEALSINCYCRKKELLVAEHIQMLYKISVCIPQKHNCIDISGRLALNFIPIIIS